ncbi:LysM peptidoglycan-binding domain-containing protein [Microbacterium arborescens]|uniref:LysM peptidoglycan-binding domain-containing protein n=1 Tax=Microbacterium arborescens TaxID=33883 RepID=UPI0027D883AC|nr:LysM domain-containing protein [Microbacterium arborescens]
MANTQSTKQTATANRPPSPGDRGADHGNDTHEVKEGETLDDIARTHKVEPRTVQRLNGIKRPDLIWPGMVIRIPRRDPHSSMG